MKLKVYEYSKCSTCRKALKFLDQRSIPYEKLPIVDQPPSEADLKKALSAVKGEIKRLFNTSGESYRAMGMSEKLKTMSAEDAIRLLSRNGKLIKRPLVIGPATLIGFNEEEWKKALPSP